MWSVRGSVPPDERIEAVTSEIEELSHLEPKCQRLMSVPGIGPLISTALVVAIDSGEAFERGRDFGAWLGLVPRQYSTGGRSMLGRISKRGSRYPRTLLIQAAHVLLMRPHNMRTCMERIDTRAQNLVPLWSARRSTVRAYSHQRHGPRAGQLTI